MSEATEKDGDLADIERRARRVWVSIVVGLLGLQIAIGVSAIVLATSDSKSAIIPNYYQSAVNWDSTRRARQLMLDLRWKLERQVSPLDSSSKRREILVRVSDSQDRAVENLNVQARVFHHADGATIYQLRLLEVSPGLYSGQTALAKSGLWQIDLQIEGDHGIAADSDEFWVE